MVVWMFAWVTAGSNEPGVHCGSGRGPARKWQVVILMEYVTCFGSCTASSPAVRGSIEALPDPAAVGDAPLDSPPPSFDRAPDLHPLTASNNTMTVVAADTAVARKRCALPEVRLMPVTVADPRLHVSQRMRPLRRVAGRMR